MQLTTNRASSARTAYHEASYRNQELRAIEETMSDCARLMQDVSEPLPDLPFGGEC